MTTLASVQQVHARYQAIADDTLYLADGRPRAIFEVFPPNLSLADDDSLEQVAQQLAVVLNNLAFPIQLLFRFVAVDLEQQAAEAERAAARRGPQLARAGRDYAALLRHLSRTRVLLELRVYVVVGLEGAHRSLLEQLVWPALRSLRGRRRGASAGPSQTELLDQRGEAVALAFDVLGARPRRLDNVEIAELLYACWCPERAGRQPLHIVRRAA